VGGISDTRGGSLLERSFVMVDDNKWNKHDIKDTNLWSCVLLYDIVQFIHVPVLPQFQLDVQRTP